MQLEHSRVWKREISANSLVVVEHGGLWLTFDGQDIVLQTGQQWKAPHQGEIVAQTLGSIAHFTLTSTDEAASAQPRQNAPHRNWLSMLRLPHRRIHA